MRYGKSGGGAAAAAAALGPCAEGRGSDWVLLNGGGGGGGINAGRGSIGPWPGGGSGIMLILLYLRRFILCGPDQT